MVGISGVQTGPGATALTRTPYFKSKLGQRLGATISARDQRHFVTQPAKSTVRFLAMVRPLSHLLFDSRRIL